MNEVLNGDCLTEAGSIAPESIDLILTDPPYGTMSTVGKSVESFGMTGRLLWDDAISPVDIHDIANRLLRRNGKMVLFSQEPYSSELIAKAAPAVPYSYKAIWVKDHFANALNAKKAMLNYVEDILLFSKKSPKHDFEGAHPLRSWFLDEKEFAGLSDTDIKNLLGNGMGGHYFTKGAQFCLPTLQNYEKLQKSGYFERDWQEMKKQDDSYRAELTSDLNSKFPSTFNLWQGGRFKSNLLNYKKDYDGHHPTQKPVLLLEDLIKTFSNVGDTVLDLTMGSGSTGVACMNTGRKFIGIEKDEGYFEIAKRRIKDAETYNLF